MNTNTKHKICIVCKQTIELKNLLFPSQCLRQNGHKAHPICYKCWWAPNGFGQEHSDHKCPHPKCLSIKQFSSY